MPRKIVQLFRRKLPFQLYAVTVYLCGWLSGFFASHTVATVAFAIMGAFYIYIYEPEPRT